MGAGIHCGQFVHFGESGSEGAVGGVELQVRKTAPRARGDGPALPYGTGADPRCSPRPWGWTHQPEGRGTSPLLLPASVGMDPSPAPPRSRPASAPCARGDGPLFDPATGSVRNCSLRLRGGPASSSGRGAPSALGMPVHSRAWPSLLVRWVVAVVRRRSQVRGVWPWSSARWAAMWLLGVPGAAVVRAWAAMVRRGSFS